MAPRATIKTMKPKHKGYSKTARASFSENGIPLPDTPGAVRILEDGAEEENGGPSSPHGNAEAIAVEAVDDLAEQRKARRWNVIVEIAGAIAGISTTAAFIPQVVEIYISGDTSGLSLPMYCIFVFGVVMWIVYGVCKKAGAMIGANIVTFVLAGYILSQIIDHEVFHPRPLGVGGDGVDGDVEDSMFHEEGKGDSAIGLAVDAPSPPPPDFAPPPVQHARALLPLLLAQTRRTRLWRRLAAF